MLLRALIIASALGLLAPAHAEARTLCTVVADANTGTILVEDGDCRSRVTPASTFKVALAVIGFEKGILEDQHTPIYSFQDGDPDWGGDAWRGDVDPTQWMKNSVLWYSRRITHRLDVATLATQIENLGYGNADFAGDPGQDNALDRAWISSSLKISPVEQIAFMRRLLGGDLPVTRRAMEQTKLLLEMHDVAGWRISGKTGSAYPRLADGSFDRNRGWGWYVGWAEREGHAYVFARLDQDDTRTSGSGGLRARAAFLDGFPQLLAVLRR